jgi:two-component system chemotaxis response regulator CheB
MPKIRVLVVDDSLSVRKHLVAVLRADARFDVVGEAADGQAAITLCERLRPDVVTLDMILPVMSGLAATEHIMAHCPTPIVIVSSSTNRGELVQTYDALAAGAVDVIDKPTGEEPDDAWERKFVATVELVSRIKVITHLRGKVNARLVSRALDERRRISGGRRCDVIGIGVSTGGPSALIDVLSALPTSFPIPILLVIHIAEPFGIALADWLTSQTKVAVRYARHGETLARDGGALVLMAPPNKHLVARDGRVFLTDEAQRHSCRPSVDVLFASIAADYGDRCAACLLTGMGKDGAEGLLAVRRAGGATIAQDEATSVVYGMPREAALLGAAEAVLPLDAIGPALARFGERARSTP